MASVPQYEDRPVVPIAGYNLDNLRGKSVIVTGGASGLGKAYAQGFSDAGAYVTIADVDETAGQQTVATLSGKGQFVKVDVRNWDEQVALFEAAIKNSPNKSCDVVIANAGIIGQDDIFTLEDPSLPAKKPDLRIIDINLIGMIYTVKLAIHYFRRQELDPNHDRCLIIKGSIAAYVDQPGSPQYNISKWGGRGLMRNLRRTIWKENIRVNFVSPWYIQTPILPIPVQEFLKEKGAGFALVEDSCKAMLRIAADRSINGRCLGIVPRKYSAEGYMDLEKDDYQEGDVFKLLQEIVLDTAQRIVE